tara:strand:- start:408 stop:2117 length:1710 start_codon:yes stop_codon:yes gene_type:complete
MKLWAAPALSQEKPAPNPKIFSDFIRSAKKHEVERIVLQPRNNVLYYENKEGDAGGVNYAPSDRFWDIVIDSEADVAFDMKTSPPLSIGDISSLLITAFFMFAVFRMFQTPTGQTGNPFETTTTEPEVQENIVTRFDDVEGIDNAKDELNEIVEFLKEPERFVESGAKIPKGALLTGSPGTGKTLLARAIAGESSVPFIQCSGSSFVEMFVGVGAKRVRDTFELARKIQPCIIFIDEIDAIGKKRSNNGFAANDEREQTINQLLTEMDGFDNTSEIVVIGATNRVDILDEALLRPGRFDRKIQVSLPDVYGREKILGVHSKNKNLSDDVCLNNVARQTIGFSGADLENLMNECAISSVREGTSMITPEIIEDAYQRVVIGVKANRPMSYKRRLRVAYHEGGHAIVGALMPDYDEVRKVSIISRGDAGGVTFFQPTTDDIGMYTKEHLLSEIKVSLGGHAAEELIYGRERVTTGATSDFSQVYAIAREMILTYGMSSAIGKINVQSETLSQKTARDVDIEVKRIVDECYSEVMKILRKYRPQLEELKDILLEDEIIDGSIVYDLVKNVNS